jgi:hypothetical protein
MLLLLGTAEEERRSFTVLIARRRINFTPVSGEDAPDFTSRKRRVFAAQLFKGQSENCVSFAVHLLGLLNVLMVSTSHT